MKWAQKEREAKTRRPAIRRRGPTGEYNKKTTDKKKTDDKKKTIRSTVRRPQTKRRQ